MKPLAVPQSNNVTRRRILAVYNPIAGRRHIRRIRRTLLLLRRTGCSVTIHETRERGDAERIAAGATLADWDAIVCIGGDGTINEIVNGLGEEAPPLGLVPAGTANVLAREIGLASAPAKVVDAISRGPVRDVSLGLANGRRFVMMAGAGFDATVVEHVDIALKRQFGKCAYFLEVLRQSLSYRFPKHTVLLNGITREAASVIVANGHHYGGGLITVPAARLDDPTLYVCIFRRGGLINVARYGLGLMLGRIGHYPDVEIMVSERLRIDGPAGQPVQADGDIIARLPVEIAIDPRRLKLIGPASKG